MKLLKLSKVLFSVAFLQQGVYLGDVERLGLRIICAVMAGLLFEFLPKKWDWLRLSETKSRFDLH